MNLKTMAGAGIVVILVLLGMSYGIKGYQATLPGEYDALATCLADKGVKFYGAFWCPHCKEQKAAFGNSAKLLPYVECSTPDSQGVLQVCKDEDIKGYPTWIFPDGTREARLMTPQELGERMSCVVSETTPVSTSAPSGIVPTATTSLEISTSTP